MSPRVYNLAPESTNTTKDKAKKLSCTNPDNYLTPLERRLGRKTIEQFSKQAASNAEETPLERRLGRTTWHNSK